MGKGLFLSLLPKYATLILSGNKRIEFRRRWITEPIEIIVLYAVSPTKRIVGTAEIQETVKGSPTHLWTLAQQHGGGISRRELYDYFSGVDEGFGIILNNVKEALDPIDPKKVIRDFRAPQSFSYVAEYSLQKIMRLIDNNRP
jgi:predicted transcriptional regulator